MDEEYERYRIDQAEAWLLKVRRLVGYERAMRDAAESQFALADGLKGIDYASIRVSTSADGDAIPRAVEAHIVAAEDLEAIAEDAAGRVRSAAAALDSMDDPTEAAALASYYIACKTWEQVCVDMAYTWQGMMTLRRRALLHAYDVMPHTERDPFVSAL